jgi:hypothetical protein
VENVSLKKALKYVLESLKKEPKSKMHRFSICALNKFKTRLPEWPEYCLLVTQTPHFQTFPSDLKTICTQGALPLGAPVAAAPAAVSADAAVAGKLQSTEVLISQPTTTCATDIAFNTATRAHITTTIATAISWTHHNRFVP